MYSTFNEFSATHPWVGQENIRPKSIAREMYENFRTFTDYINDYELHRAEGVLLRHLSSVHKVLAQTVPDQFKTEPVQEMEAWLAGVLRGTDSSLLDEWERLRDPNWKPGEEDEEGKEPEQAPDITRNRREFTALIRTEIFKFLRPLATENYVAAIQALGSPGAEWTADKLAAAMDPTTTSTTGSSWMRRPGMVATPTWRRWRMGAPGESARCWWMRRRSTTGRWSSAWI